MCHSVAALQPIYFPSFDPTIPLTYPTNLPHTLTAKGLFFPFPISQFLLYLPSILVTHPSSICYMAPVIHVRIHVPSRVSTQSHTNAHTHGYTHSLSHSDLHSHPQPSTPLCACTPFIPHTDNRQSFSYSSKHQVAPDNLALMILFSEVIAHDHSYAWSDLVRLVSTNRENGGGLSPCHPLTIPALLLLKTRTKRLPLT